MPHRSRDSSDSNFPHWYISVTSVVAIVAFIFYSREFHGPEGTCNSRAEDGDNVWCSFSESYWEARAKFRHSARKAAMAGVTLHSLSVLEGHDYTIDIAVVAGTEEGCVVHTSGVHGVEGYAGSAVQISYLNSMVNRLESDVTVHHRGPTVVLVHAVNPYGMAHFRRFNENNVDLNRNGLHADEWHEVKARDPNVVGYENFNRMFNPQRAPQMFDAYVTVWLKSASSLLRHGFVELKRALVSGQYHEKQGIFYGGSSSIEQSHQILWAWLSDFMMNKRMEGRPNSIGTVTWVDVHTGLGPSGKDTLLLATPADTLEARKWFHGAHAMETLSSGDNGDVLAGYEVAVGYASNFYGKLFSEDKNRPLLLTQEFGTLPGILVARALILENQAFNYDPQNQPFWSTFTRDAFYVRTSAWKRSILDRGTAVLAQAIARASGPVL